MEKKGPTIEKKCRDHVRNYEYAFIFDQAVSGDIYHLLDYIDDVIPFEKNIGPHIISVRYQISPKPEQSVNAPQAVLEVLIG